MEVAAAAGAFEDWSACAGCAVCDEAAVAAFGSDCPTLVELVWLLTGGVDVAWESLAAVLGVAVGLLIVPDAGAALWSVLDGVEAAAPAIPPAA